MKKKDSLLVSLRDCAVGWIPSTVTLLFASSWNKPHARLWHELLPLSLMVALVIMVVAFPISIFSRRHLPSDSQNGNSLILGVTGIFLSQLIVQLPILLFNGLRSPDLGRIYEGMAPFLAAAAVAGGVIGHMAGVPSKLKSWQLAFEYDPEKK